MDMQPRKAGKFLKLKGEWASLLPLALISASVGAFVIGVGVYAVDTLEPPTALFPDQGSLPSIGGGGAGNLLEVLRGSKPPAALVAGASYAKWAEWKDDTLIGGRLGLGQIIIDDATSKAKIGYPLDIQVIHDASPNTDNTPDTAIIRLAGHDKGNSAGSGRLWSGLQIARTDLSNTSAPFSEKWFIGMNDKTDNLVIRWNGSDPDQTKRIDVINLDPAKGAACVGATFANLSNQASSGYAEGYVGANKKCPSNTHICSVEEITRTIFCKNNGTVVPEFEVQGVKDEFAWVLNGPPSFFHDFYSINDCSGWTDGTENSIGAIWNFTGTGGSGSLNSCDQAMKFACCK